MGLRIVPGTANPLLAAAVARTLRTELVTCELDRFPDGERARSWIACAATT